MKVSTNRKSILNSQVGMTLVEIMIVIAIIGGLVAVLGGTVVGQLDKSRVNQSKIQLKELQKRLDMYNADCGTYPTTEQFPAALLKNPGEEVCANWGPDPYMKKEKDAKDAWSRNFLYESDGSTITVLKSLGKDGREGGDAYGKDLNLEDI